MSRGTPRGIKPLKTSCNHHVKTLDLNHLAKWRLLSSDRMKLVDSTIRSFRVAKVFRENSDRINHIDFSPNGETLITSSDDDSIVIYDCQEGK